MKRLLVIGDSVSKLGTAPFVKAFGQMYPDWSVAYSATNNQGSLWIKTNYSTCIGDQEFDFIKINCGIHDVQVTPQTDEQYTTNLNWIISQVLSDFPSAKIIWQSSTPLNDAVVGAGKNDQIISKNAIAVSILDTLVGSGEWTLDDAYTYRTDNLIPWAADGIHFDGYYQTFATASVPVLYSAMSGAAIASVTENSSAGICADERILELVNCNEYSGAGLPRLYDTIKAKPAGLASGLRIGI